MSLKRIRKYLWPDRWPIANLPRQIISDYHLRTATKSQILIMQAGYARSPAEAQRLLDRHNCTSAADLIRIIYKRPKRRFWRRLHIVLSRIEGAQPKGQHRMKKPPKEGVIVHYITGDNHRI